MFRRSRELCLHVGKDADGGLINIFAEIARPAQLDRRVVAKPEMPALRAHTISRQQAGVRLQRKNGRHAPEHAALLERTGSGKNRRTIVVKDSRADLETIE